MAGGLSSPRHCREVIETAVKELGGIDILVSNAAFQMSHETVEEIPDEEWDFTIATNLSAFFHLVKAALPHMRPGASIIATTSINYQQPSAQLLPYAVTKAGIANVVASLAQGLAERGIRVNGVAPGPIWTPLIPSTMPEEAVESFGQQAPLQRPGQQQSSRRSTSCSPPMRSATFPARSCRQRVAGRCSETPSTLTAAIAEVAETPTRGCGCRPGRGGSSWASGRFADDRPRVMFLWRLSKRPGDVHRSRAGRGPTVVRRYGG
jgi:NAD(P)-dependent dehydrogenase (short-subunit alcohol dehydrogenase family)